MVAYRLLYLASLVTFSFGALTFLALILLYARQRGVRKRITVLPAFTVMVPVCTAVMLALLSVKVPLQAGAPS